MATEPLRIIFAGTPAFSEPYLQGLLSDPDFLISGVITQPDKPSGREKKMSSAPIKLLAQANQLIIWQPEKLSEDKNLEEQIRATGADLLIVVAYGQIIPQAILDLFSKGAINVHPSLLPKYRGASPIQSALLNGEQTTGISIMLMDAKMDHGPILAQEAVKLDGEETNESLHIKLARDGVPLLIATIKQFLAGGVMPQPQDDSQATFCATISKEDGRIDWSQPAQLIKQQIQAFYPWPATWTTLDNKRLKIFPPVSVLPGASGQPGQILFENHTMSIACGQNHLQIEKIQLEGKNESSATDFIRGHQDIAGKILT